MMTSSLLRPLVFALLCAPLAFSPTLAGQTTTPMSPTSDPQAIAFATKALAALTGSVQVSDVTLTGTATRTSGSDIETGTVTLQALGTANSRMDLSTSSGTRSEIHSIANGTVQGSWVGLDGTSHAMAYHNCMTDAAWFFPVFSILSQASSPTIIATYVGQETRGTSSVQHLHLVSQAPNVPSTASALVSSLTAEDVYLDATSLLPVAIVFNTHPDNNAGQNIAVEIDFSNYQSTGGAQVPLGIQQLINNSLFLDITVQSVTLNSGLTQSTFSIQ